ncbi:MAG: hypothetical protein KDJ16_00295 [Hyphomicrobiales bacterium]|nr:hypothetical protein [Hyphomicrobiales bacterium]
MREDRHCEPKAKQSSTELHELLWIAASLLAMTDFDIVPRAAMTEGVSP